MTDPMGQPKNADAAVRFKALMESLPAHFKKASARQQERLLAFLENWQHSLRRRFPRKPCALPVDFAIEGRAFVSRLGNISAGGAFVEKANGVLAGQQMTLVFSLPLLPRPSKLKGAVVWPGAQGFGVRSAASPYSEAGLEKAIERL